MTPRKYTLIALITLVLALGISLTPMPPALTAAWQPDRSLAQAAESVPLFDNLGDYHFPISTQSPQTQDYFDQGMTLAYGFNHAEAARAFQAAIRHDDTCALCHWGLAYVLGPNINAPMELEAVPTAWDTMQQAQALSALASPKEQALIQAMATRYTADPDADRAPLDQAYASAMGDVYQRYPNDPDVGTLYAEALMDTMPWDYWDEDGNPRPETEVILTTLESVIDQHPQHIGALHLYIHAVEKEHPELAETAADTLGDLAPGAGHLVHMPSHIYIRIGRYHDAAISNLKAVTADHNYLHGNPDPSLYTVAYMPHNQHFLWFAALMNGQSRLAIQAAIETANVDPELMRNHDFAAGLQHYFTMPLFTRIRFQQWDIIRMTPAPAADLKYPTGIWHYAQGMAAAANGNLSTANEHLALMETLAQDPELAELRIWGFNSTSQVLNIAAAVLEGEIALAAGDVTGAIAHLQQAVELEGQLVYTEPPDWYSPTRNLLGKALLETGQYAAAEAAFRADLEAYPNNGWSLYGLTQSLQAQDKAAEAAVVQTQFETAWQDAELPMEVYW
ncbi:MAG: tetratricopeptide repeat protein [Leptolyngbya sp. SIO1D8]|nr:tetratricopeptide repeat protein [Leptolyngbya sp. SIO1D8]